MAERVAPRDRGQSDAGEGKAVESVLTKHGQLGVVLLAGDSRLILSHLLVKNVPVLHMHARTRSITVRCSEELG
jgi:rRNA-processing protein FCF1